MWKSLGVAVLACGLLLLAGCGGVGGRPAAAQPGQLRVVAAFYPLQFVAERVAGNRAVITSLTQPGAEPHDVELTPRQVAAVIDADAVVYLRGFQPAVDEAVAQSGNEHVLDTTTVVPLQTLAEERSGEEDHADHDQQDHDHGQADPHVWLDPVNMVTITRAVVDLLSAVDADHATAYASSGKALISELERLDAAYHTGLQTCERTEFITSHAAFGYLAERYGLTQIGISGLTPDAEPSPARVATVQQLARTHGVTTIFYETLVSPEVANAIAGDLGLRTDVLDPVESLTEASRGDNYIAVMESNLTALEKANGCQ